MTTVVPHRHALRHDTAANWTADNPVLGESEEGVETDTGLKKRGDGSTAWVGLPYADRGPAGTDGTDGTDGAPGSSDLTFADNGDGTGTIAWNAGANTVTFPLLTAGLIGAGVIPAVALSTVTAVADEAAMLALTAQQGDVAVRSDNSTTYMLKTSGDPTVLADWIVIAPPGAVVSVAGKTGVVTLVANDITDATTTGKAVMTASNQASGRSALGLGTSATVDTGTTSGTIPVLDSNGKLPTSTYDSGGALTSQAGSLGTSIALTTTPATVFSINGLAAGTWLITVAVEVYATSSAAVYPKIQAVAGTGAPSLSGRLSASCEVNGATNGITESGLTLTFLATCTASSTVTIQGFADATGATIHSTAFSLNNISGWTAVKIA